MSSSLKPVFTRIPLAPLAALGALQATIRMEYGVFASFEGPGKAAPLADVGIKLRVDQEGEEGLYHIHLKPDGTWLMSADVKVGSNEP